MSSPTAVAIKGLKFSYTPSHPVLDIDELTITRGEHVFLHGPSGSGKTTLLGILSGILEAPKGQVKILGTDLHSIRGQAKDSFRGSHIGYIFQMFNLIPYLSVLDNIILPCHMSKVRAARAKKLGLDPIQSARRLCEALGIGATIDKPVTDLSVGQQQRVAAARALIGAPELIIADEPTSSLDFDHRENFLKLLFHEAQASQATVIFVSHDHSLKHLFPRLIGLSEINRRRAI